jgi:ankyrin repeat protein
MPSWPEIRRKLRRFWRGVQVNDPMDINGSPLHLAAAYGSAGIVKDLLAAGANIEAEDYPAGVHPLHVAADAGKADVEVAARSRR